MSQPGLIVSGCGYISKLCCYCSELCALFEQTLIAACQKCLSVHLYLKMYVLTRHNIVVRFVVSTHITHYIKSEKLLQKPGICIYQSCVALWEGQTSQNTHFHIMLLL